MKVSYGYNNYMKFGILLVCTYAQIACKFKMYDGREIDLSNLYSRIPDYEGFQMEFVYRVNICGPILKYCGYPSAVATKWVYNGGCLSTLAREGDGPTVEYLDVSNPSAGVSMTYKNGDPCLPGKENKVIYKIHCSDEKTRLGLVQEVSYCTHTFDFFSKEVCWAEPEVSEPLGVFFWVLLSALALIGLYIGGGIIINKRSDPDLTIYESFPNREYWIDLSCTIKSLLHRANHYFTY